MIRLSFLFFVIVFVGCTTQVVNNEHWVYVSSGTNDDAYGLEVLSWNANTGELKSVYKDSTTNSSSYLTIDDVTNRLYAINGDGIYSYQIDKKTGKLDLIDQREHLGVGPCYVSLSSNRQNLLVAYYRSGSVASYEVMESGAVGDNVSNIVHSGSSVNKNRQESAHAHMILPAPKGDLVYITDLGTDLISTYKMTEDGVLIEEAISETLANLGNGPRHLDFHPDLPYVFVLAELTGHVLAYEYHEVKGIIKKVGEVSILPSDFDDFNKSADIHVSPDGKYLYASNRGNNSIAVCAIGEDGSLTLLQILDCGGIWPRAFEIDPSGSYLLVANKRSDAISLMNIDNETGTFLKTTEIQTVVAPQCIKFLKK